MIITRIIAIILFVINIVREIRTYIDTKSSFYCKHCGNFNENISSIGKCKKCHRDFKIRDKNWNHLLLHKVNYISAKSKSQEFKWKEYKKICLIEISLSMTAVSIVVIDILINII